MDEYGYCGRVPRTAMERAQARVEKMYADEDRADRRARFEEEPTEERTKDDDKETED